MGTRGFVGTAVGGKLHLSYIQYDSYPSGVGARTVDFARQIWRDAKWSESRAQAENMLFLAEDAKIGGGPDEAYHAHRQQQGDIGAMFASGVMVLAHETWPHDSLFCEWGYLINFDQMTLEVYQGFQRLDAHTRCDGFWRDAVPTDPAAEYGPVRLLCRVSLTALASASDEVVAEWLNECEETEATADRLPDDLRRFDAAYIAANAVRRAGASI